MIELQPEYLNKIANQLLLISSLLGGFSITVLANLLVTKSDAKIIKNIMIVTTIAASSLLVSIFSLTNIVMITTEGYPLKIEDSNLNFSKIFAVGSFLIGIIALSILIALSGWTRSKRIGMFTTIIGALTLILMFLSMSS